MKLNAEIESCLAYQVLRDPDEWIGAPSASYLQAFLLGAEIRASCVKPSLPRWRVFGVLEDTKFYKPFVAATGHPTLSIKWAIALEMTHFSISAGYTKLRDDALAWHNEHGVAVRETVHKWYSEKTSISERAQIFWTHFAQRPAVFMGDTSGWGLYCFLSGMGRGGDWLALPEMPRLGDIINRIAGQSEDAYGSPFAAFRVYRAEKLLEWAGLTASEVQNAG